MTKIMIDRPRDPLAGMIASYRSAYARKWRMPVSDASEHDERAPETTSGETDAFVAKIRGLLFGGRQ